MQLVREGSVRCNTQYVTDPSDVYELTREVLVDADRETMLGIYLNIKNKIVAINTIAVGMVNSIFVQPREIFKPAILANASAVILAHNHPSGDPAPSAEDVEFTQRIAQAGEILGIKLLDHVVVGD